MKYNIGYLSTMIFSFIFLSNVLLAQEDNCVNGIDDDGDYYYDCLDSDCSNSSYCKDAWGCTPGLFEYSANQIYRWNIGLNGQFELVPASPPLEQSIRILAHNDMDGYLYGLSDTDPVELVKIDNSGKVKSFGIIVSNNKEDSLSLTNAPIAAVCRKGKLFVYYKGLNEMSIISITPKPSYKTQVMKLNMVSDVVLDHKNDLLYTIDAYGQLQSIYPDNQVTSSLGKMMGLPRGKNGAYPGVWIDRHQRIWVRNKQSGEMYEIRKEKAQANQFLVETTKLDNSIIGSWSCALATPPFVDDVLYMNTELQQGNTLVRINWGIMDEAGRLGYRLEHSTNNKDWEEIGQIKASYNYPDQLNPYGELDRMASFSGSNFYVL